MSKARKQDSSPEHRAAMRHLAKVGGMTSIQVRRILRTLASAHAWGLRRLGAASKSSSHA